MFSRTSLFTLCATLLFAVNATAKVVTQDVAQDIVKNFMTSNGIPQKEMVIYHSANDDQGGLRAPLRDVPAYHIFKATDSNDFIIVAGDDIARPILGYSFNQNNDNPADIPPAMQDWLDEIEKQILQARSNGTSQSARVAALWRAPEVGNVVKYLGTAKWNQQYPFNIQCPFQDDVRCYTGCTSTAYAIMMKYYGYPSAGRGVTPAYTCSNSGIYVPSRDLNHSYDWNLMPNEFDYSQIDYDQAYAVARLMADIGAALQADYTNQETSAPYNKSAIFAHFGYNVGIQKKKSDYTSEQWSTLLKNELDKDRPVLYNGVSSKGQGAHAFLIDGYTDQDLFIVNWGWGGNYDGAYALDALELDFIDFNGAQSAFFDFQPADGLPCVAVVNDSIECPSLEAAVGMAPHNGEPTSITMLQNSGTDEIIIKPRQNVILNLNGCTLNVESFGIFNWGNLTVTDSTNTGKITVIKGNISLLNNYRNMTVEGVEISNQVIISPDPDYRRCIWSDKGTTTTINSGTYNCIMNSICSNGRMTINGGLFTTTGNTATILNYSADDTLFINGGTFKNTSKTKPSSDYRRAVWTCDGSVTQINDGQFSSDNQVLTFNGDATINGATIDNTADGIGINSYGKVIINDCKLYAKKILTVGNGHTIKCRGGIYSAAVGASFIASGYKCMANRSSTKYPYKVVKDNTDVQAALSHEQDNYLQYDLNGVISNGDKPGIRIIRKPDGKTVKILNR